MNGPRSDTDARRVAMLAPRGAVLGCDPCGGSEVVLREDRRILEGAGARVVVYAQAAAAGAHQVKQIPSWSNLPLVTSLEYCGRFVSKERQGLLIAYNEPAVVGMAPDRSVVRFDWKTPLPRYWKLPFWKPRFQRALYLFPSEHERAAFLDSHPAIPKSRAVAVPNAVDTALFTPKFQPVMVPRVGFAGQWAPEKGIGILLEAWKVVHRNLPKAELWLAGGTTLWKRRGEVPGASRAMAQVQSALDKNVRLIGSLPHREMPSFWNSLTIAAVPSFQETFGLAALEALSCGIPVVASRVGGLPEIVSDGNCGILVNPGRSDELAQAILTLLTNESLRCRFARSARERAAAFSNERRSKEFLLLVKSRMDESRTTVAAPSMRRSEGHG